ncbi:MAG: hypothetical protein JJE46_13005, partial [Acidimicrobiia bacterium]|nr:hypothetical protein [Acidimicrobiia bacterium]
MNVRYRLASTLVIGAALALAACSSDGLSPRSASTSTSTSKARAVDPASVAAAKSEGCNGSSGSVAAGQTKQTLTSGGEERWYYRDVPTTRTAGTPLPVVFDFHGYSEGADVHLQMSGLSKFGDEKGFVTITPQGTGPVVRWDNTIDSKDETLFGEMLDQVESQLCVDTNRIYVTGLSNGAFMTSAIACQFSDRVAAVAPVAGVRTIEGCSPTRAVPIVAFHGTADGYVAYDGGLGEKGLDLPAPDGSGKTLRDTLTPDQLEAGGADSIPKVMAAWAKRNGCTAKTTEEAVATDVTMIASVCPAGHETVLY